LIWISIIVLAIAVSFDSWAMGITYGMNRITIPLLSKTILSIVSGLSVLFSMTTGWFVERRLNPSLATTLGGFVLVLLGLYHLWHNYGPKQTQLIINWRVPVLGLIIQVLREPLLADSDHSQTISSKEAVILGGALALDAMAAGFGAAMLALPMGPTTVAVMLANYISMAQGLKVGATLNPSSLEKKYLRWLPGTIVLAIGLLKIMVP
jgi:putative sporulation protein YtaF